MDEKSSSSGGDSDSNTKAKTKTNSPSNEESLRISTSSSWTILPANRIDILESTSSGSEESATASPQVAGDREQPNREDEQANEHGKLVEDPDTQAEDVSDGISIISDCESTGRLSPHPFLREHLNELGFKYDPGLELPTLSSLLDGSDELQQQLIRERRHATLEAHDTPATSVVRPHGELSTPDVGGYRLPTLVQSGLTAVFYVGATLAILAFIGRLRNPEWQVLGGEKPLAQLEQRLVELELQNNLMRAEIDIMSKQMQYLSGQAQGQSQSQSQSQAAGRKPKTFKAWPGNGNAVDPMDITKADLKRAYKCPEGKYGEIAGMCMESQPHAESLADEIGNVVNDVLQQSQAFQQFEKVTERLGTLAGQDAKLASDPPKAFHAHANSREPTPGIKPPAQPNARADDVREHYKTKHSHKRQDHSNEQSRGQSKEHSSRYRSNEYDSKERKRHGRKGRKSEEQLQRSKLMQDPGDDSGSGEWHERMMQHREHSRQRHEQKRKNNWYIERGGSREQIRSGETRH